MNYKNMLNDIKDEVPPVRFFSGKRYRARDSGYTKKEAYNIKEDHVRRLCCSKNDIKPFRDSDGLYTLYYLDTLDEVI